MRISGISERHVRFRFSPARETIRSIEVLLQPAHHAEQMPWIRLARRRLQAKLKAEIEHFRFLFLPAAEVFPTLWGKTRANTMDAEIAVLRTGIAAYKEAVVRRLNGATLLDKSELKELMQPAWYRPAAVSYGTRAPHARAMLAEFAASPAASSRRFCALLTDVHNDIVQPVWGSIESTLARDVAMRRDLLRTHGVTALLRTLSSELSVKQGRVGCADIEFAIGQAHLEFDPTSRLELSPSFFCWPHVQAFALKEARGIRFSIAYPVPPLPARIKPLRERRALARLTSALADETRLNIVELLRVRDLSTREISGFLAIAAPLVSRHLRALLLAQLVETYRNGYFVMYRLRRHTLTEVAKAIADLA